MDVVSGTFLKDLYRHLSLIINYICVIILYVSYTCTIRGTADVACVLEHEGQYHYSPLHEMLHSIKVQKNSTREEHTHIKQQHNKNNDNNRNLS